MLAANVDTRGCTIQDALRFHTREIHQQLHVHSHFVALFEGTIAPSQYRDLMIYFHGFYAPLEQAIDHAFLQVDLRRTGYRYAKRAGLLVHDLAYLGQCSEEIDRNPMCPRIADVVTPESLGGVLYVIEGATLGAAQIDRAAQKILERNSPRGRRFWAWSRANNKARWAAINAYLTHLEKTCHPEDAIIQGANDTFQTLASWLAPLGQPEATAESRLL